MLRWGALDAAGAPSSDGSLHQADTARSTQAAALARCPGACRCPPTCTGTMWTCQPCCRRSRRQVPALRFVRVGLRWLNVACVAASHSGRCCTSARAGAAGHRGSMPGAAVPAGRCWHQRQRHCHSAAAGGAVPPGCVAHAEGQLRVSGARSGAEADVHGFHAQGRRAVLLCCGRRSSSALQTQLLRYPNLSVAALHMQGDAGGTRLGSHCAHYLDGM